MRKKKRRRRQRSKATFSTSTSSFSPLSSALPKNQPNSSRRTWKPNVQHKSLWLSAAGRHVRLPVTTTALRTIDKAGGLDLYLLNSKRPEKLDPSARALRDWLVGWNAAKEQMFNSSTSSSRSGSGGGEKET